MRWIGIISIVCACGDSDGGDGSGTGSQSQSASESASSSSSSSDTGTLSATESSDGPDSGTTGNDLSCDQATDVTACMAAGSGAEVCIFLPSRTWVGGGNGVCESIDVGPTGVCAVEAQDDGCISAEPTCPDGGTSVWYREVGLEVGAIEIVSFGVMQLCEPPSGFMQCSYDDATSTFTPPECSCGCPMGQ
jgi:hypothetical protein